jgi:hypothetical protein
MDPLSITLAVISLSKLCKTVVKILKNVLETMKRSRQTLFDLISETERIRLLLDSLRELARQLQNQGKTSALFAFDSSGCEKIILDVQRFTETLADAGRSFELWRTFVWSRYVGRADSLLMRLKKQEDHINSVLMVAAA